MRVCCWVVGFLASICLASCQQVLAEEECKTNCPRIFRPICGDDDVTYNNHCLFKIEQCQNNKELKIKRFGKCPVVGLKGPCTRHLQRASRHANRYQPRCDDEGLYTVTQCHNKLCWCVQRYHGKRVSAKQEGEAGLDCEKAQTACPEMCTKQYRPVCDSNGDTHSNACTFNMKNCQGGYKLRLAKKGRCDAGRPSKKVNKGGNKRGPKRNGRGTKKGHPGKKAGKGRPGKGHPGKRRPHRNPCHQPGGKTGKCKAAFTRWFFNKKIGECEQFRYGGCGGNGNNFRTELACTSACAGKGKRKHKKTGPEDPQPGPEVPKPGPEVPPPIHIGDRQPHPEAPQPGPPRPVEPKPNRVTKPSVDLAPPPPVAQGEKCAEMISLQMCLYGRVVDANGCPTSKCKTSADV